MLIKYVIKKLTTRGVILHHILCSNAELCTGNMKPEL